MRRKLKGLAIKEIVYISECSRDMDQITKERDSMLIKSPLSQEKPRVHPEAFVAPTAIVIGDVEISEGANIWFSAVLRADWGKIIISENTNCLDNCTIVAGPYTEVRIGENCIIGHNTCITGPCRIQNNILVGSNVTILPNSKIYDNCIIDSNCVVKEGMVCRSRRFYSGDNNAELLEVYADEAVVRSQIMMKISYYGENSAGYKEAFGENEEIDEKLMGKVKEMSIFKESNFRKYFK